MRTVADSFIISSDIAGDQVDTRQRLWDQYDPYIMRQDTQTGIVYFSDGSSVKQTMHNVWVVHGIGTGGVV